jgi:hypothetical protein
MGRRNPVRGYGAEIVRYPLLAAEIVAALNRWVSLDGICEALHP